MNQSIKAKILPLFPILDLNELRRETHLEDAVLSGDRVLLCFFQHMHDVPPSHSQYTYSTSFPPTHLPVHRSQLLSTCPSPMKSQGFMECQ